MRHIIPISGKDSLATAIWQTAKHPELVYEFVYNDTNAELPETYEWLSLVEKTLGITIKRIGKSLEKIIEEQGILPSARTRFCTKYSKIFPMRDFVGKDEVAIVYFGLRSDEPDRVGAIGSKNLIPKYPLREDGIGLETVYKIVGMRNLMPPSFFWQSLHDAVMQELGENKWAIKNFRQWMIDRMFAWRSRPNCFFCFFQRRYEWVGLLEHHPELFDRAEKIETETGNQSMRREEGFYWIEEGYPLSKIRQNARDLFRKRVLAVSQMIYRSTQMQLFEGGVDEMDISKTSCGLLCGK